MEGSIHSYYDRVVQQQQHLDAATRIRCDSLKAQLPLSTARIIEATTTTNAQQEALLVFQASVDVLQEQLRASQCENERLRTSLAMVQPAAEMMERAERYRVSFEQSQAALMQLARQMTEAQINAERAENARKASEQARVESEGRISKACSDAQGELDRIYAMTMRCIHSRVRHYAGRVIRNEDVTCLSEDISRYLENARLALSLARITSTQPNPP